MEELWCDGGGVGRCVVMERRGEAGLRVSRRWGGGQGWSCGDAGGVGGAQGWSRMGWGLWRYLR